ncbi:MAG: TetR/AcrR family transcriptional regulator [Afipia sp.]|jgi:TetR/AcrR family transcriptional repressor of nem operon|nr:TetR/AcrR family transcriptional regulator [Afipia sp.]
MRYSKDHKAETHERIVKNASVRLREGGAASIGVADLMKEAGLTHGGFYAHFASRDALIGEAFAHAMEQTAKRWRKRAEQAPEGKELASIVAGYLTAEHRDDVGNGCALPSLGAEVLRANPKTRKAVAAKLEEMIDIISEQMPVQAAKAARREAIASLATMMGTLMLARMAGAGDFSEEILAAGRHSVLQGEASAKPRTKKSKPAAGRT